MKFLKTTLLLAALAACASLSGCTACDNMSSSMPSSLSSSSEFSSDTSSFEGSVTSSSSSSLSSSMSTSSQSSSSTVPTMSTDFGEIGALSGEPVTWGPGRQFDAGHRPTACLGLQEKYSQYNAWFIGNQKGKIYLTFDEGYENGYTSKILDVLKEKDVKAIFFITGHYVKTNPELVQRMIDEGHVLGNHSNKHPQGENGFNYMPLDAIQNDIMALQDYVLENFHYTMNLFRFPEGTFTERNAALLGKMGYRSLFWSFAYLDYDVKKQPTKEEAYQRMVDAAHDGAIYLLHAVSQANAEALPGAIDTLRQKGYDFALFDETLPNPAVD